MNNKTSGIGCSLLILAVVIVAIGQFLFTTPIGWILLVIIPLAIWISVRTTKKANREKLTAAFETDITMLNDIVAGKGTDMVGGLTLKKGEQAVYACPTVALTEYQSTGSTYSGSSAGVSFPLVGRIRGNVGGQSGSITKNPEELMIVDEGRAIFTNQRIVFSGAKFVREWDLDKVVDLVPTDNGYAVRIAVSNRERTSGLQALTPYEFGPGFPAAYVFNLHQQGQAEATTWANNLIGELRQAIDTLKTESTK